MNLLLSVLGAAVLSLLPSSGFAQGGGRLLSVDHYVAVKSTAPDLAGRSTQIYVREVALESTVLRGRPAADRVVLFVHGAGTPAEVAFDVPYRDYSWMAFLAQAGFDTFAMDMTGYGRSTRPPAMNDPCNLTPEQQARFVPQLISKPCPPSQSTAITTMGSDWNDIGAVVDHIRSLRGVDRVSLLAWSQGGPRAGGFAARNPAKVSRLVVLAPAYNRGGPLDAPTPLPRLAGVMNVQSREDFIANWDRQVGCPDQYDRAVSEVIWKEMVASDSVGATWGPGVRRAPQVPTWGFNQAIVSKMQTPFLMIAGIHDKQVVPGRVRELYTDLGSAQKVIVDLGCASHNAMWERNRHLLFKASLEWLRDGTVNGMASGEVKLGY